MASISSISPKLLLVKMADMFQNRPPISNNEPEEETIQTPEEPKNKLNISLDDLKIISTALLQYKRTLAKKGENKRVEEVSLIDQKCYHLILGLESHLQPIQPNSPVSTQ